jgi:hypothetical protein
MGGACGRHEENRNTYGVLVLKSLKEIDCFDSYAKWEDNKMILMKSDGRARSGWIRTQTNSGLF